MASERPVSADGTAAHSSLSTLPGQKISLAYRDSTIGGEIKQESETDPMQGIQESRAGIKQEDTDGTQHFKQESDDGSVPGGASGFKFNEGARKSVIVKCEPGQSPIADSLASDEDMGGVRSGEDDDMTEDEEEEESDGDADSEHTCVHEHTCGHVCDPRFRSDVWGNDFLKRTFDPSVNDIRAELLGSAELGLDPDYKRDHPENSDTDIPCVGELSLGSVFPMPFTLTATQQNAMKALGLHHYCGVASLDITVDGQPEPDGTEVTLFTPVEVFHAITKLCRPDRHTPTHQMWCSEASAARNWNVPFNEDRLRGMEDVLEWDIPGTHTGVVIEDEESGDMSKIDLKLVLRARSDRGFVPPWDL